MKTEKRTRWEICGDKKVVTIDIFLRSEKSYKKFTFLKSIQRVVHKGTIITNQTIIQPIAVGLQHRGGDSKKRWIFPILGKTNLDPRCVFSRMGKTNLDPRYVFSRMGKKPRPKVCFSRMEKTNICPRCVFSRMEKTNIDPRCVFSKMEKKQTSVQGVFFPEWKKTNLCPRFVFFSKMEKTNLDPPMCVFPSFGLKIPSNIYIYIYIYRGKLE